MHKSAMLRMEWFVKNYIPKDRPVKILDVGSYDVNGSYRRLFEDMSNISYVGLDMSDGPNVDYAPKDPYDWSELDNDCFDYVISGNAFEHIEYPWLTICEIYKKLKPGGVACILAPNTIDEHRYPLDCYRYYSDGFRALAKWAGFKVISVTVSGVPDKDVDEEWYIEGTNDTFMIVGKEISDEEIARLPKLNGEKRHYSFWVWIRRYNLLKALINDDNPARPMKDFFAGKLINKVYLYGYGDVGKIIYKYVKNIGNVNILVMDQKGGYIGGKEIIRTGDSIEEDTDCCMLITVLEAGIRGELNKIYPNIAKYYADEIYYG